MFIFFRRLLFPHATFVSQLFLFPSLTFKRKGHCYFAGSDQSSKTEHNLWDRRKSVWRQGKENWSGFPIGFHSLHTTSTLFCIFLSVNNKLKTKNSHLSLTHFIRSHFITLSVALRPKQFRGFLKGDVLIKVTSR